MKTVGVIGGMSWESTQLYYQLMNRQVQARLGGHNSIEAIIFSVNFEKFLALTHQNNWKAIQEEISRLAKKLEAAGAHFLILAANSIHMVFPQVEASINIPLLHIADPTAEAILQAGVKRVALLGTKVTMEEPFYRDRLSSRYAIETIIPESHERQALHRIIFDELTVGKIYDHSRKKIGNLIQKLRDRGAKAVILGCTELSLLLDQEDSVLPLFDTMTLHAKASADLACAQA